MGCCNKEMKAAHHEELKASCASFGFDVTWITDLVAKYGSDVLALVVEGVRGGFSKEFVTDVLDKFGPVVLELLVGLMNKRNMNRGVAGDVVVADQVGEIDASLLQVLLEKYLPMIIDKYGDKLVAMIVDFLIARFSGK